MLFLRLSDQFTKAFLVFFFSMMSAYKAYKMINLSLMKIVIIAEGPLTRRLWHVNTRVTMKIALAALTLTVIVDRGKREERRYKEIH